MDLEQPSSNLFEGYRSVGNVTGPRPFIVRHGKNPQDTRILTIVGKAFHTYTTNLTLVEVSLPHESDIRVITSDERRVYSSSGRTILCWGRSSKELTQKLDNGHQSDVTHITKLGKDRLLSIDEDNSLFLWRVADKSILNIISIEEGIFKITAVCHPLNYQDKVLLGSKQGALQLWNVVTETCLYKFKGWDSSVTCLVQSPKVNIVGIGLEDGHIYIHDIRYDTTVMKIYQEYGAVTSMSFRLDGQPYLVTASEIGHLNVWNLERKRLSSQVRYAHSDSISRCQFIRNESLLVTSGTDNKLKIFSMDKSDGGGSLLCQREGHSEPPNSIKFYGSKGFELLSAGKDSSLRMFHMYSERLNRNLGIARAHPKIKTRNQTDDKKLPSILGFAAEEAKEKQWDNIAAYHEGSDIVTTWNYDKCRMGEHMILQPTFHKHGVTVTSICITGCGNYVVIGFSNGLIFKYNMQSGLFRQTYETGDLSEHRAHDGAVTGVLVDGIDVMLITSGNDCKLRLWNFKTGAILATKTCPSPIVKVIIHRENNLLAASLENNDIEIIDLETRSLVRRFSHNSKMSDMIFSPDSMWLIVAYEDSSIRTWDLTLGKLIDSFRLRSPCTSLSISSTGEFLATAHRDSVGINIWCNYTLYCPTALRPIDPEQDPPMLDMPHVRCDEMFKDDKESDDQTHPYLEENTAPEYVSPEQLHKNLITLSDLPVSRWKNLLNIDELRQKQLIEEESSKAKQIKVPFFIPVKDGLKPILDEDAINEMNEKDGSRSKGEQISKIQEPRFLSPIAQCLINCNSKENFDPFIDQMKKLGPSATDVEIRSLGSDTCGSNQAMLCFLEAIDYSVKLATNYELTCSWLALFLKAHSDLIRSDKEVRQRCLRLLDPILSNWNRLNEEFNQIFCVLNFIRSSIL